MSAYYNEFDPYAAQWLRNLIHAGLIATGEVDERSIRDVHPVDLLGYTQCHFFAGIGVWSHALRLAGWPDDRPVWTGSCPCQPFSAAGKGEGVNDDRHLWPEWARLIRECKPGVVFGEQVEAAIRHGWLDLVQADLEGLGYAFAPVGVPAAGFGAPHIRARLWFVAESDSVQSEQPARSGSRPGTAESAGPHGESAGPGATGRLGNNNNTGLEGQRGGHRAEGGRDGAVRSATAAGESGGVAFPDCRQRDGITSSEGRECNGAQTGWQQSDGGAGAGGESGGVADTPAGGLGIDRGASRATGHAALGNAIDDQRPGPTNGHWRNADWLHCRDGKWRPVESTNERMADGVAESLGYVRTGPDTYGLSPLVKGAKNRVGRLRAYGNAIVPQVASEIIAAYMECRP